MPAILIRFFLTYVLPGLLIAGGAWYWLHTHDKKVTAVCEQKQIVALQTAQIDSQKQVKALEDKYNAEMQELLQKPDSGYGVGPFTTSIIDGL